MRSLTCIHGVSAHAESEIGDLIVGGVAPPSGTTVWDMREALWGAR